MIKIRVEEQACHKTSVMRARYLPYQNSNVMITTIHNGTLTASQGSASVAPSIFKRFITWAEGQQENRLLWLGIALTAHASFLTPFTAMAVMFGGNVFPLFMATIAGMAMALVPNLAALPTKITIPAFILSIVLDVAIVLTALSMA
jgi:hypothetical protein